MYFITQLKRNFTNFLFLGFQAGEKYKGQIEKSDSESKDQKESLTPEQEKIKFLQDKLGEINATQKITKKTAEILYKGLMKDPSIKNDPEAKETIRLFEKYKLEFEKAKTEGKMTQEELEKIIESTTQLENNFEYNVGVDYNNETKETENLRFNTEKLQTITNHEFLELQSEERLQYITKNHIDSESIANGSVDNVEFTFTFDGKYNEELYLNTTAGQVLPKEVREVISANGDKFIREGNTGEFFNFQSKRLIIKEGTKVSLITGEVKNNKKAISDFIEKNSKYKDYSDLIEMAIEKGIDPGLACLSIGDKIRNLSMLSNDRKVLIEDNLTDFHRIKGNLEINNIKDENVSLNILQSFNSDWKEKAKNYGISEDKINEFGFIGKDKERLSLQRLEGLKSGFKLKTKEFLKEVWQEGIGVFVTEGYRSQARQNELYAKGRTTPGNKVTWTLNSNHTKGIAFDIAFDSAIYGTAYPNDFSKWRKVANIAKKHGIDWGYDLWGKDKPHFQEA